GATRKSGGMSAIDAISNTPDGRIAETTSVPSTEVMPSNWPPTQYTDSVSRATRAASIPVKGILVSSHVTVGRSPAFSMSGSDVLHHHATFPERGATNNPT